jgi:hypothetical protein
MGQGVFKNAAAAFGWRLSYAGVAAIGPTGEPQQQRNVFVPSSEKGHGISENAIADLREDCRLQR